MWTRGAGFGLGTVPILGNRPYLSVAARASARWGGARGRLWGPLCAAMLWVREVAFGLGDVPKRGRPTLSIDADRFASPPAIVASRYPKKLILRSLSYAE